MWSDECNVPLPGDRITRFASPNRYDSLDAPASFLDKRMPRSRSTNRNATPATERLLVESSMPQSYSTSGSAVVKPQRVSNVASLPAVHRRMHGSQQRDPGNIPVLSKSSSSVIERMSEIESNVERLKLDRKKEHEETQRDLLMHQIGNNSTTPSGGMNSSKLDYDVPLIYASQYSEYSIDDKLSESQVNSFFTPAQPFQGFNNNWSSSLLNDELRLEAAAANSAGGISTRVLIQSDASQKGKTLTYNGGGMIDSSTNLDLAERLDSLAEQMGLVGASTSSQRGSSLNSSKGSSLGVPTVYSEKKKPLLNQNTNGPSPPDSTPKLRSSRRSLLGSLLRRLSPRLKRRSKSFSPSRLTGREEGVGGPSSASTTNYPGDNTATLGRHTGRGDSMNVSQSSSTTSTNTSRSRSLLRFFSSKRHKKSLPSGLADGDNGVLGKPSPAVQSSNKYNGSDSQLSNASNVSIDPTEVDQSRKSSSTSGNPTWNTTVTPDNRRLLKALEQDRVANPYAQFKASRHAPVPPLSGGVTPMRPKQLSTPVAAAATSATLNNKEQKTPPKSQNCTPEFFTFDHSDHLAAAAPTSPRYLNLSLSAFGYSNYRPREPVSPATTSAAAASAPCPSSAPVFKGNRLDRETERVSPGTPGSEKGPGTPSAYHCHCGQKETGESIQMRKKRAHSLRDSEDSQLSDFETRSSSEEKEARHRSSLIMLTVAKGSPRSKGPSSTGHHFGQLSFDSSTCDAVYTDKHISPRPGLVRQMTSPPNFSFPDGSTSDTTVPQDRLPPLPDDEPSAEEEEEVENTSCNGSVGEEGAAGRRYLALVDQSEQVLREKIEATERDLREEGEAMTEEVSGQLRTAAGKASLLITEKFSQFRGLCDQNLASSGHPPTTTNGVIPAAGPEYVTLDSDLEGFWAMVLLQVEDVSRGFREIDLLKADRWQVTQPPPPVNKLSPQKRKKRPSAPSSSSVTNGEDQARAEARRRLMAAKRQALLNMKLNNTGQDDVVIYT